jgi:glycosyltransferase involved in cell wall biosynthesis
MKILTGIPAYNVEDSIVGVIERVKMQRVNEIIVINDGSRDMTEKVISAIKGIKIIQHKQNKGYGEVQKTILDYFINNPEFEDDDILIFVHGDGEMLPEEINKFRDAFIEEKVDMVFGSRVLSMEEAHSGGNEEVWSRPAWKVISDKIITFIYNLLLSTSFTTIFGGYRGIRKKAAKILGYKKFSSYHFFDHEILVEAMHKKLFIREIPVTNVECSATSNYWKFQYFFSLMTGLIRLRFRYSSAIKK